MLFSSIIFLCFFFPVVLLGNYILEFSRPLQNGFLLIASLFFYAWGEPTYVLIMLASIILNYVFALLVDKYDDDIRKKKFFLVSDITVNLGILFIFKYLGFVIRNINALFGSQVIPVPKIALPLGISFFTFQALSYVVDVYRKDADVQKNPFYLGLYISFFPQLIAGPIVKYKTVADQILNRTITKEKFSAGCTRFAVGFAKKILLSNNFATISDQVFGMAVKGTNVPVTLSWVGVVGYTIQIFFDFSAYSDMAIGLGLMFGFKFEENFNYPYIAKSISDFWNRWHISMTSWFQQYVYFPLGGSRVKNKDILIRNIFIVWLLTGVWHGAEWTFILWGLWNFVFIFLEKLIDFDNSKVNNVVRHIYTLWVVVMGFVFFKSKDLEQSFLYLKNMYGLNHNSFLSAKALMLVREYWIYWVVAILLCTPIAKVLEKKIVDSKSKVPAAIATVAYPVGLMAVVVVAFSYLVRGSYNPFIYFNF